jgi:hypothetical protein
MPHRLEAFLMMRDWVSNKIEVITTLILCRASISIIAV